MAGLQALQAIVFDFDGVIAHSEPLHLRAFQRALAGEGLAPTADEYYERYLGFDDAGVIRAIAGDRRLAMSDDRLAALIDRKAAALQDLLRNGAALVPGAGDFVRRAAAAVPIAIASGALRREILEVIGGAGLDSLFAAIVAAGETSRSKPSPEPYRAALAQLSLATGLAIDPARCVAIEDSIWGLTSARAAGLRCVGLTTSYAAHRLEGAELVVDSLEALTLDALDRLCTNGSGSRTP